MKRIGLWSFDIYDESIDPKTIKECCIQLNDSDNLKEVLTRAYSDVSRNCIDCGICEMSINDQIPFVHHVGSIRNKMNKMLSTEKE